MDDERPEVLEILHLEECFRTDLEEVFEGRQEEFTPHLRALLFDLWLRARDTETDLVKELETLRELKKEKQSLEEMVKAEFHQRLPAAAQQFKQTFENVLGQQLEPHLISYLEGGSGSFDGAFVQALERVTLSSTIKLERMGNLLELEVTNAPSINVEEMTELLPGQPEDELQKSLRSRLQWEGLIPPEGAETVDWAPMMFNTKSGVKTAFQMWNPDEKFDLRSEPVEVPLAWDGSAWRFPNPRPRAQGQAVWTLKEVLELEVDGIVQSTADYDSWLWTWTGDDEVETVDIPVAALGDEIVLARYPAIRKL